MKPRFKIGDKVRTRYGSPRLEGRITDRLPPDPSCTNDEWYYKFKTNAPKTYSASIFEMAESSLEAIADDWASEEPL